MARDPSAAPTDPTPLPKGARLAAALASWPALVLFAIIIGGIAGLIAKFLLPGRDPGGLIVTILLGIGGALVAGFLGQAIGLYREGQPVGFIAQVIGAIIILLVYRLVTRSRAT